MAATRGQAKKFTRPGTPNDYSPSSRGFQRPRPQVLDDPFEPGSSSLPPKSKAANASNYEHPRSRFSRQETDYVEDNDPWVPPDEPYTVHSHCAKGMPPPPPCSSHLLNSISRFPGPGAYNAVLKSGGPSFSIGSRSSLRSVASVAGNHSPGPGSYNVKMKSSGPSFSMGPKLSRPTSQQDMNPGPGSYSDLSTAIGKGLAYSIRGRF